MVALILFDTAPNLPGPGFDPAKPVSPGFFAGWETVTHTVTLRGDQSDVGGTATSFSRPMARLYRTGCSTAVGQRFE